MAEGPLRVTLTDTGDLKAVMRELRRHADGKELAKQLRGELREVMRPFVPKVRAAYRAAPSRGVPRRREGPGLRTLLAKATRVEVRTTGKLAGARVRVDGRKMPPGMGSLPSMWEGPPQGKRWRHPVHGDRETWVSQESHGTFHRTVHPDEGHARTQIELVVGRIFDQIERAR